MGKVEKGSEKKKSYNLKSINGGWGEGVMDGGMRVEG